MSFPIRFIGILQDARYMGIMNYVPYTNMLHVSKSSIREKHVGQLNMIGMQQQYLRLKLKTIISFR